MEWDICLEIVQAVERITALTVEKMDIGVRNVHVKRPLTDVTGVKK